MINGLKEGLQFTVKDNIKNRDILEKYINIETDSIYNSPIARRNRSRFEIFRDVMIGKTGEVLIIDNIPGFSFSNLKYNDLVDSNGDIYEIKVKCVKNLDMLDSFIRKDLDKIKKEKINKAKYYVCFIYENKTFILKKIIKI